MIVSAADLLPWLPVLLTLLGGLVVRWVMLSIVLPPVLRLVGEIGRRCLRRLNVVSLLLVAAGTANLAFRVAGLDDYYINDVILLVGGSYVLVELLRTLVVDYYWIRVQGYVVPRLLVNVGEAVVYLVLLVSVGGSIFQLNVTPFLATSAVLSAVIGLAMQDTLGSLFAGLALHADQPHRPGDWVLIAGYEGEVVETTWRSTTLRTRRNELVVLPNGHVAKSEILNYSRPTRAVERMVTIGLSYDVPPDEFKRQVLDLLGQVPGILAEPPPDVRLLAFGEYRIEYQIVYHITNFLADMRIAADVRRRLWYLCQRQGMTVPMPIRHVVVQEPVAGPDRTGEVLAALAGVDFLAELPIDQLAVLAQQAEIERWGGGEVLFRQGDAGTHCYVVLAGAVQIEVQGPDGKPVTVGQLGPGEFFGEMSLLTGEPRRATVISDPGTELVRLATSDLAPILSAYPDTTERISHVIAERSDATSARMAVMPAQQRLLAPATGPADQQALLERIRGFFGLA